MLLHFYSAVNFNLLCRKELEKLLWALGRKDEENTQESDYPGRPLHIFPPLFLLHDVYILCIKILMHKYGQILLFSKEVAVYLCLWVF